MGFLKRSPQAAPDFALYRDKITSVDSLPEDKKAHGMNMGHYRRAIIDVIPTGGANPTVDILWWSEQGQKFVQESPNLQKAGVGVNVPYQFSVEANGRIMLVAVTTLASGSVDISVAGYELDHTL